MNQIAEVKTVNSICESMAVTEFNLHGYDQAPSSGSSKYYNKKNPALMQVQVPQFYEFLRTLKSNKSTIKDETKDRQVFENAVYS